MAIAVVTTGPALVRVDTGASNALEDLGYSVDGVQIIERTFISDVYGDQNGGTDGPPIELQYMGQVDTVRMELSKFDDAVVDKIRPRLYGGTLGSSGTAGTLIAAGSLGFRLLIEPTTDPRNYLFAIPREPIEVNRGTKRSLLIMEWECHANASSVLWNATTT